MREDIPDLRERLRVGDLRTNGQTYDFHILPSGLLNPNTDNLIGSGVVFNWWVAPELVNSLLIVPK